jgi:hypothetical protein
MRQGAVLMSEPFFLKIGKVEQKMSMKEQWDKFVEGSPFMVPDEKCLSPEGEVTAHGKKAAIWHLQHEIENLQEQIDLFSKCLDEEKDKDILKELANAKEALEEINSFHGLEWCVHLIRTAEPPEITH